MTLQLQAVDTAQGHAAKIDLLGDSGGRVDAEELPRAGLATTSAPFFATIPLRLAPAVCTNPPVTVSKVAALTPGSDPFAGSGITTSCGLNESVTYTASSVTATSLRNLAPGVAGAGILKVLSKSPLALDQVLICGLGNFGH